MRVFSSFSLSRWCRPMLGSSRIYSTPIRLEPIWVARRMRWLSPPERVAAERARDRYPRPTLVRKPSRAFISFTIRSAIIWSFSLSWRESMNSRALNTDREQKSAILMPPTVTARAVFFRRMPPQVGQGVSDMHSSMSALMAGLWVSR